MNLKSLLPLVSFFYPSCIVLSLDSLSFTNIISICSFCFFNVCLSYQNMRSSETGSFHACSIFCRAKNSTSHTVVIYQKSVDGTHCTNSIIQQIAHSLFPINSKNFIIAMIGALLPPTVGIRIQELRQSHLNSFADLKHSCVCKFHLMSYQLH